MVAARKLAGPADAIHCVFLILCVLVASLAPVVGIQVLSAQEQAAPAPAAATATTSWQAPVAAVVLATLSRFLRSFVAAVPRVVAAVVTLLLFWALASGVRWLARFVARLASDPTLKLMTVLAPYYAVWVLGIVVALDALGLDAQTLATGFGLTGIGLSFALKDILSNFVSGLLLLVMRSFQIGDQIVVGQTEGTVEQIELRVTHIRTYDGRLVLVPNAEVFTSRVTNNTASPLRRGSVVIPLEYKQDLSLAIRVMEEVTRGASGVAADPPPSTRLFDLMPEYAALESRFWTHATHRDFMDTSCMVRAAIVQALRAAGIQLPDPNERVVAPGDVERWRAVFGSSREADQR